MSKTCTIFVAGVRPGSGASTVAYGLAEALGRPEAPSFLVEAHGNSMVADFPILAPVNENKSLEEPATTALSRGETLAAWAMKRAPTGSRWRPGLPVEHFAWPVAEGFAGSGRLYVAPASFSNTWRGLVDQAAEELDLRIRVAEVPLESLRDLRADDIGVLVTSTRLVDLLGLGQILEDGILGMDRISVVINRTEPGFEQAVQILRRVRSSDLEAVFGPDRVAFETGLGRLGRWLTSADVVYLPERPAMRTLLSEPRSALPLDFEHLVARILPRVQEALREDPATPATEGLAVNPA